MVHTAESVLDTLGPDTGAENVAAFIQRRTTPGSYHDLVDSDSALQLVPYEMGAYQDGTGSNSYAMSISFALRTTDWRTLTPERRRAFLRQAAAAFARQQAWLRARGYPATPLRWLTRAESEAGQAGFITHARRDPARRTDPGA
ncbi:MAG: N-acetylmuramoyl-L-alanine amidase, partial [Phycicoccus sp.]